eukprot:CAMPEP_0185856478 /NCGR_PEP_ID=MMETSP1354-20130828/29017_1 /TAXON_ID=708628 /ORGANISM="Erythrolobus madagascarensis, Strain CCMP3276" /LENGTH=218 /DNA_ID=CAMNT_0028558729 /DNA_START=12 /DNA_END=668 /DNA_ORIENTATION=+
MNTAFVTAGGLNAHGQTARRACVLHMVSHQDQSTGECSSALSRRSILRVVGLGAATALVAAGAEEARADGLGGSFSQALFPKGQLSEIKRDQVVMDKDVLNDPAVKAGLAELREYRSKLSDIKTEFGSDPQMDIDAKLKGTFSVSKLRDDLNKINSAFDEETQIRTDRIVRGIIQDLGEIAAVAKTKPDVARTPKKIEKTKVWLDKLSGDFDKLLSFY